jgi:hypothetical protein
MGSYISTSSIYNDRFSRITSTVIPSSQLSIYITDAEAMINGYIAKQYTVADIITANPPLIQSVAKELTIVNVLKDNYTADNQNFNEWLQRKEEKVYETLDKIANDEIRLVSSANASLLPAININMGSSTKNKPLIMNIDDEYDWRVPQNLLDDIDSERSAAD